MLKTAGVGARRVGAENVGAENAENVGGSGVGSPDVGVAAIRPLCVPPALVSSCAAPTLRVTVHEPSGAHCIRAATVTVTASTQGSPRQTLVLAPSRRADGSMTSYIGRIAPGMYDLHVETSDGLTALARTIDVLPSNTSIAAHVGRLGWPWYRLGDSKIPFDPAPGGAHWLAIAFESRAPPAARIRRLADTLADMFGQPRSGSGMAWTTAASGAALLLRVASAEQRSARTQWLRRLVAAGRADGLPADARVGVAVDPVPGRVKVIDNRFVIEFADGAEAADIERIAATATLGGRKLRGRVRRGFVQAPRARLIEFQDGDLADHLAVVEEWLRAKLITHGEPDVLAEIRDDAFPNDESYPLQSNLRLQGFDTAWQLLRERDPALVFGSDRIRIATLDTGVDVAHPDVHAERLEGRYDLGGPEPCRRPIDPHGMAVYGIISAAADNHTGIAGIAPNVRHIAIRRPAMTSVNYCDALLWAAGFASAEGAGSPARAPVAAPADIINCSHGVDGLALSKLMDDTLNLLTDRGRGGRGTLVVYSAGNSRTDIAGFRTWAAHPRTLAVSNTKPPNREGLEVLSANSSFGPDIDLCAQGDFSRSLGLGDSIIAFHGTSAAAPAVAAAAALMLSVDPSLDWTELRRILQYTAIRVDAENASDGRWIDGFSEWYGHGRLNAAAAIRAALRATSER